MTGNFGTIRYWEDEVNKLDDRLQEYCDRHAVDMIGELGNLSCPSPALTGFLMKIKMISLVGTAAQDSDIAPPAKKLRCSLERTSSSMEDVVRGFYSDNIVIKPANGFVLVTNVVCVDIIETPEARDSI